MEGNRIVGTIAVMHTMVVPFTDVLKIDKYLALNTILCCDLCAQQIDLEFELKFHNGAGDMMATLVPDVVDPLLHYAAERGSRAVRDVAATAHGKTTGLCAML